MGHRSKHRRENWIPQRRAAALDRAAEEAKRPAPKVRVKRSVHRRRTLPVLAFLGIHR